jgi:hypothetical protein
MPARLRERGWRIFHNPRIAFDPFGGAGCLQHEPVNTERFSFYRVRRRRA